MLRKKISLKKVQFFLTTIRTICYRYLKKFLLRCVSELYILNITPFYLHFILYLHVSIRICIRNTDSESS